MNNWFLASYKSFHVHDRISNNYVRLNGLMLFFFLFRKRFSCISDRCRLKITRLIEIGFYLIVITAVDIIMRGNKGGVVEMERKDTVGVTRNRIMERNSWRNTQGSTRDLSFVVLMSGCIYFVAK